MSDFDFFSAQVKEWDELIKKGSAADVRKLCRDLNYKKIPRPLLIDYAQIARRVGAEELILTWLRNIVLSEKSRDVQATESEKAIYALSLFRLGAFSESGKMLWQIDPEVEPQVYFYRASWFINQWNYQRAIPELKKYITNPKVISYQRWVGRLNLCAAYAGIQNDARAAAEISKLMKILNDKNAPLLQGNLLEIQAQVFFNKGRLEDALKSLTKAAALLQGADLKSSMQVQKWRLVIEMRSADRRDQAASQLDDLREQAEISKDWETYRDCDFQKALAYEDAALLEKIYWGSHFKSFKKRILEKSGIQSFGRNYVWIHGSGSAQKSIDLVKSAPTKNLKKLFFILTRELYGPLRITEICDQLYPDDFYNPLTSPEKVNRMIIRARRWLNEMKYPIEIKSFRNAYKLELTGPGALFLEDQMADTEKIDLPSEIQLPEIFVAKDWALARDLSIRRAQQQIAQLVKRGQIEVRHHGSRRRYRLKMKL